jgi:nicotinamide mononucleotide (NMN) deamidase PncC
MGRLNQTTLAAYALVDDPVAREEAVQKALESLADSPDNVCVAALSVTALHPADGGAAIQEVGQWLLAAAIARGPGTALHAQICPESVAVRRQSLERT